MSLALTVAALPAAAADWGGGNSGIRDYGGAGGVPIPAPVPIPEYKPNWYFRLDAAIGIISEPDISEEGFIYGLDGPGPVTGPGDARTLPSSLFSGDFSNLLTLGGGVGFYVGNGWRIDATVEKRSKDDAYIQGSDEYETNGYADFDGNALTPDTWGVLIAGGNPLIADNHSRLTISDTSAIKGTVWTANVYYDLASARGFTPYVGAGVGFVWNQISRSHTSTLDSCDNEAAAPIGCAGGVYTGGTTTTAQDKSDTVSLAAAAMAGFSYDVSDITAIDVGYRYLYLGGTSNAMTVGGNESRLSIGDQHVHQLRAGLRFNVD